MFKTLSERIVSNFESFKLIETKDKEVYLYGVQQGLNMILNLFTTLLIGLVFHAVDYSFIFLLAYMPLRSYAGGYHARTSVLCYFYSIGMIIAFLLAVKFFPLETKTCNIISAISGVIIFSLSPVEALTKKLDDIEKRVYRHKARILVLSEFIIQIIIGFTVYRNYEMCISLSFFTLAILILIALFSNSVKKDTSI